jgi:ribonuclease-3
VRAILEPHLFERIEEFISDEGNVNYKSTILEMSQRDGFGIPRYTVLSTSGPEHDKRFRVGIEIGGVMLGEGQGTNKKLAQQNAAHNAIEKYNKQYVLSYREGAMAHELVSH